MSDAENPIDTELSPAGIPKQDTSQSEFNFVVPEHSIAVIVIAFIATSCTIEITAGKDKYKYGGRKLTALRVTKPIHFHTGHEEKRFSVKIDRQIGTGPVPVLYCKTADDNNPNHEEFYFLTFGTTGNTAERASCVIVQIFPSGSPGEADVAEAAAQYPIPQEDGISILS